MKFFLRKGCPWPQPSEVALRHVIPLQRLHMGLLAAALLAAPLTLAHPNGLGLPKTQCETDDDARVHDYGEPSTGFTVWMNSDGSLPPCPYGDGLWDGHWDFAMGGAILLASEPGASYCYGGYAHHTPHSVIWVQDAVLTDLLASDVGFAVYSDALNNLPLAEEPNCGDGETDFGVDCVNSCAPGFPPGLDGAYHVYVSGTTGHIFN